MKLRLACLSGFFEDIVRSSVIWVTVGVPVAAVVAAFRVFVWVLFSLPEMIVTAAVLGAVHGLWLHTAGSSDREESASLRWFGPVSGGVLGILAFLPVFSRIDEVIADRLMISVFLVAAICGGMAAGFVSARVVSLRPPRFSTAVNVLVGCLLILPLASAEYHFFWPAAFDRLPVPAVSRRAVADFPPGNAQGSMWAGCYEYLGQTTRGSGGLGREGGLLRVNQNDGSLTVSDGDAAPLAGAVNNDGHFRFGVERNAGQDTLRVLWQGTFKGTSLDFSKRTTLLRGTNVVNTTRLIGSAQRIPCDR